jgi:cellulose synthase/poly-beta-1,6-N-acetylglucosamine synthase-like glycosyltransferase
MHVAEVEPAHVEAAPASTPFVLATTAPKISVIIPCRNESKWILRVLEDLAQQTIVGKFEVLIADGDSDDGTWTILQQFQATAVPPFELILLRNHQRTIPCALNLLVSRARGKFIVRIDAHSRTARDYLERIVQPLESGQCDVAGPRIRFISSSGRTSARAIASVCNSRMGNGGTPSRIRLRHPVEVDHTVMSCFAREVWVRIGGYDQSLQANEDFDYDYRAARAGFKVMSFPDPVYSLAARASFRTLVQQRWRYGFWKAQTLKKFPASLKLRQLVPIIVLPTALALTFFPHYLAIVGMLYLLMVLISLDVSLLKEKGLNPIEWMKVVVLSAAAMLIVHFVWSAGVWRGLLSRRI